MWRRQGATLVLGSFMVIYASFISTFVVRNDRTALPLLPCMFVFAAAHIGWLADRASRNASYARAWAGRAVLVGSLLVIPIMRLPATAPPGDSLAMHAAAREWVAHHVATDAPVVVESYGPYLDPQRFTVLGIGSIIQHDPQWYVDNKVAYVIASAGMYGRYYQDPQRYAAEVAHYDAFFARFEQAYQVRAKHGELRIYRVTPTTPSR